MDCLEDHESILDFSDDGFININIVKEPNCITLQCNVTSKEDFQRWKEVFCLRTNMCFNVLYGRPVGVRKLFKQKFICHHGVPHKGVKKTPTGCKVFMDVSIRIVHKRSPEQIKNFPCFIKISGHHNHSTDSADALNQLRVHATTKNEFHKYFEQGMSTPQAQRHHICKMDLTNHLSAQSNHAISPKVRAIRHIQEKWMQQKHGDLNGPSMFDAIHQYGKDNPELVLDVDYDDHGFCVVLITPFMRRAHKQLREASEVVFVDATGCVDRLNTAVIPLLCSGPAGAVPLAVLFTSSQDGVMLTKGFGMVKKALGESAFFGRGAPEAFMTDNCDAERKALAATWPSTQLFLCIFHLLQQVWRWLMDSKHSIRKDHRQELMAAVKALVYAETRTKFEEVWGEFQMNPTARGYSNFLSYITTLIQRKEEWAIAFRAGVMLRGHHTNNYCEATMAIIKDIVLSRRKALNTSQLVVFMVEIFDQYMKQRLVDVALKRRRVKPVGGAGIPMEAVISHGEGKFSVQSQTDSSKIYSCDLLIGTCTCIKGENGDICKHQIACAEHGMTVAPQVLVLNSANRRWLAALALGEEHAPDESFFKELKNHDTVASLCTANKPMVLAEDSDFEDFKEELKNHDNVASSSRMNETMDLADDNDFVEVKENLDKEVLPHVDRRKCLKETIRDKVNVVTETLLEMSNVWGDEATPAALDKLNHRLRSPLSSNHFNTILHTTNSSVKSGGAGRGKIPCQPTSISRRSAGTPRGAAALCKGRRPTKRPHNLARSVLLNVANAKLHGSGH